MAGSLQEDGMQLQLDDQVAIVTGAGSGVGEVIAQVLAAAGAAVVVNDLNPDRAERVAAAIRTEGGRAIDVVADVANKFQCAHLVETARAEWGRLDILVNNAAVAPAAAVLKMDEWDWNRCIDVNLKAVFLMSQLCGRVMADENKERGGAIINVASTAGPELPLADRAAYCASQAGIVGFARQCAREFTLYGIRVNTILVDAALRPSPGRDPLTDSAAGAAAVANLALFLCSDAARHLAGAVIPCERSYRLPAINRPFEGGR
jgi:NAD(P)-dependent dehydrogenase (short-subunit alcohol dehydrogenase family)